MTKTKGEIAKKILKGMLIGGAFVVACSSPAFAVKAPSLIIEEIQYRFALKKRRDERRKYYNSFYYLKKKGFLKMEYRGKQLYVYLSKEGKKLAQKYSIDDLVINKPKKWDHRWRILMFDVEEKHRIRRDALRGKLKELGLFQLQKSVWVCPYHFEKEVEVLRNFFGFSTKEMTTMIAVEIAGEERLISFFNLNDKKQK